MYSHTIVRDAKAPQFQGWESTPWGGARKCLRWIYFPLFFTRIAFSLDLVLLLVLWVISLLVELSRICVVLRDGFLAPRCKNKAPIFLGPTAHSSTHWNPYQEVYGATKAFNTSKSAHIPSPVRSWKRGWWVMSILCLGPFLDRRFWPTSWPLAIPLRKRRH